MTELACLRHLRELRIDNNRVSDISGLAEIDGLQKLSLRGNALRHIDFSTTKWTRLETLNLSRNEITRLESVDTLQSLISLNLGKDVAWVSLVYDIR
jgi:Leucine-rich repeat (LRR) protein